MFASRLLRSHLRRRCRAYGQFPAFKNDMLDRIVYNSVLQNKKTAFHWRQVWEKNKNQKRVEMKCIVEPMSLQFLDGYGEQDKTAVSKLVKEPKHTPYSLPYSIVSKISANENGEQLEDNGNNEIHYDCKSRYNRVFVLFCSYNLVFVFQTS